MPEEPEIKRPPGRRKSRDAPKEDVQIIPLSCSEVLDDERGLTEYRQIFLLLIGGEPHQFVIVKSIPVDDSENDHLTSEARTTKPDSRSDSKND